jgi:hypothetical protein
MEEISEKTPAELEKEFYSKKFYLSYSGLSKMIYSPSLFYRHYVLQQREEKLDSYLIEGKIIHCMLLDDGSFDKQFIVSPTALPTGNTKLVVDRINTHRNTLEVIKSIDTLKDYSDVVLTVLKEINLHQSLKTDAQRIEKIATPEAESYFQFLMIKGDKHIVDEETLKRCDEAVQAIRNDSGACELLGLIKHETENVDIFNEIPIESDITEDFPFGIKGIIDNIKVDYDKKLISVNDVKNTSKTIVDFPETVEYYNYWVQAAIYNILIRHSFKELIDENWAIRFSFVVVDKYNQVYPFYVKPSTMENWSQRLTEKLNEFKWHYTEKKYKLPYAFEKGEVTL